MCKFCHKNQGTMSFSPFVNPPPPKKNDFVNKNKINYTTIEFKKKKLEG